MDILTYLPAIVVILGVTVPCIYLFWKWLREDAEKKRKDVTPEDKG